LSLTESRVQQLPRSFEIKNVGATQLFKDFPDVLTMDDVAKALRIGRSAAYELARQKDFPTYHAGRTVRTTKPALIEWIRRQEELKKG